MAPGDTPAPGPRAGSEAPARRWDLLVALALLLATFAVYAQVRSHAFLSYDDPAYVVENPNLRVALGWDGVRHAFFNPIPAWDWVPLTTLSLQLDYHLHGLDPAGFLFTNVALHALASLMLYAALARMTQARGRSAFVAAVFALHPLHVESVAWISERKDVLSGLFCMLTLYAYAGYAERPRPLRLLGATLWLLLGLLSKSTLVTLPAVLLLLDVWPLGRLGGLAPAPAGGRVTWRRALLEKLPMFVLAAAVAAIIFSAGREAGAMSSLEQLSLGARVGNALESYVVYLQQSVWPSGLAVLYPRSSGPTPLWPTLASALLLGAVTLLVFRSARTQPYFAVGWLWYLGMLVPTIGLVQVGAQARADRFMYLPLIGLSIMLAWGASDEFERLRARRWLRPAAAAALAALGIVAWLQVRHWQDTFTLFEHALAVAPESAIPHMNLADAHLQAGAADAAERHFERAAALDPHSALPRLGLADVRALRGDLPGALEAYERERAALPDDAVLAGKYGFALLRAGRAADAQRELEIAVAARPGAAALHIALAVAAGQQGRLADAIAANREALRLDAGNVDAANNLAWLLATRANASPEEQQLAVRLAERASAARGGDDPSLLDTLAVAYAAAGQFEAAVAAAARGVAAAEARGQPLLAREIRGRGELYAARRSYVEPPLRPPTGG